MNNTKIFTSLDSTSELKKLIVENPDLPLLIFCGEEAYNDDYCYSVADAHGIDIKELTIYEDTYIEKEDFKDRLLDDYADAEEYATLTDREYEAVIETKVAEAEFVKAIVVYVG